MTLTEAIEYLEEARIEVGVNGQGKGDYIRQKMIKKVKAMDMADKALRTMKDINEAESIEQVVEILTKYSSEVEV